MGTGMGRRKNATPPGGDALTSLGVVTLR